MYIYHFFFLQSGEQTVQYNASVGIVCMCLHKKLLFAGCYDGNIYVFNTTVNIIKYGLFTILENLSLYLFSESHTCM